jgi:DNA polymerase-3 subunit gamma/tau
VPATIVSRCQRFDLRRIRPDAIRTRLQEIAADEGLALSPEAAERLARMARGGLRDAISLLEQAASFTSGQVDLDALRDVLGLADTRRVQEVVEAIAGSDGAAALGALVGLVDAGADLRLFADELARCLRGLMFAEAGATRSLAGELTADELSWLEQTAQQLNGQTVRELLRAITDALARVRDSSQFQLQLELAVLDACLTRVAAEPRAGDTATPELTPVFGLTADSARPRLVAAQPAQPTPEPAPPVETNGKVAEPPAPSQLEAPPLESMPPALTSESTCGSRVELDETLSANGPLDLELVQERWPRLLEWVRNRNPIVASLLQPAQIASVENGWLTLSFAFKVHHERIAEVKNRSLIEDGCKHVLGHQVRLRSEHTPPRSAADTIDLDDPVLRFALERFGGRAEWAD